MNKHELSKILSEYTLNNNKVEFINVDNQMNIPEYWKKYLEMTVSLIGKEYCYQNGRNMLVKN
ncbi:hypothetical protein HMPREF9956_0692 [Staphylococcus epidermidis 14.1.R1.SE]|nr:hypothetical protein HMPREF9956_0692 [Staphylococcus epidermidis 14.1.R1.SE]